MRTDHQQIRFPVEHRLRNRIGHVIAGDWISGSTPAVCAALRTCSTVPCANSRVAAYIASGTAHFAGWPVFAVVLAVVAVTVFLSELTSNTAQVATMLPILAAAASGLAIDPLLLILPCTLAASCAFMMPVGTPPNAIIFGTGLITIRRMCKTGVWLNLMAIVVITLLAITLTPALIR